MYRFLMTAILCIGCGTDSKPSADQPADNSSAKEGFNWGAANSAQKIKFISESKKNPFELSDKAHEMIHKGEVSGLQASMLEMMNGQVIQSQVKIFQLGISDPDPAVQNAAKELQAELKREMTKYSTELRVLQFDPNEEKSEPGVTLYSFCKLNEYIESCDTPNAPYDVIEVKLRSSEGEPAFLKKLEEFSLSSFRYRKINFELDGKVSTKELEGVPADDDFIHIKW